MGSSWRSFMEQVTTRSLAFVLDLVTYLHSRTLSEEPAGNV